MVNLLDNALVHGAGTIRRRRARARRACPRRGQRRGAGRARGAAGGGLRPLPQGAGGLARAPASGSRSCARWPATTAGTPASCRTRRPGGGGPADRQAARRGSTWPGAARIGRSGGRGGHAPITGTWIDTGGRGSRRPRSWMADQNTEHPIEVELKLRLPPAARTELELHPALQAPHATAPEERHEVTTYFDTPDLALAGKGVTLRVRRNGDRRVQTVKLRGAGHAVAAQRGEWEWPIEQDTPDLARSRRRRPAPSWATWRARSSSRSSSPIFGVRSASCVSTRPPRPRPRSTRGRSRPAPRARR